MASTTFNAPSTSTASISFPPSTRVRQRILVVRNPTKHDVVFKVQTDKSSVVLDPSCGQIKASDAAVVTVYVPPGKTCPSAIGNIAVYVRPIKSAYHINFDSWFYKDLQRETELAFKILVERRSDFAALETICDLPGSAILVESVPFPITGLNDDDTRTAIGIDSDTITARHFNIRDIDDALPSETLLDTCRNVLSDVGTSRNIVSDTRTARDINEVGWLQYFLDIIFPPPNDSGIHKKMSQVDVLFPCGVPPFALSNNNNKSTAPPTGAGFSAVPPVVQEREEREFVTLKKSTEF